MGWLPRPLPVPSRTHRQGSPPGAASLRQEEQREGNPRIREKCISMPREPKAGGIVRAPALKFQTRTHTPKGPG